MTPALETPTLPAPLPLVRWPIIASIIRKDMRLLAPYAIASAIGAFLTSALFHNTGDISAFLHAIGATVLDSGRSLDIFVIGLFWIAVPVVLSLFVILLAQTNVAADTRHDWLTRPINPLELVAAKALAIVGVVAAPTIAGAFVYMMAKGAPAAEAFAFLRPLLICFPVLTLSWLASTPFRAVLALLGMFVLLSFAIVLPDVIKTAIGSALASDGAHRDERPDLTPFPDLHDSWVVSLVAGGGLYVASGAALWLLLARRKHLAARWLFVSYLAASTFLQSSLFTPIDDTRSAASKPQAATTQPN